MKQPEMTPGQAVLTTVIVLPIIFLGLWCSGSVLNGPSNVSPREQAIRDVSDKYGIPMDEVRRGMNRIEGKPRDWQLD